MESEFVDDEGGKLVIPYPRHVVEVAHLALVALLLVLAEGHLDELLELVGVPQGLVNQTHSLEDVPLSLGDIAQFLVVLQGITPSLQFLTAQSQLFENSLHLAVVLPGAVLGNQQVLDCLLIPLVVAKADGHLGVRGGESVCELVLGFPDLDGLTEVLHCILVHLHSHVQGAYVVQEVGPVEVRVFGVYLNCSRVALEALLVLFKFGIAGSQIVESLPFLLLWLCLFVVEGVYVDGSLVLLQFEITVSQVQGIGCLFLMVQFHVFHILVSCDGFLVGPFVVLIEPYIVVVGKMFREPFIESSSFVETFTAGHPPEPGEPAEELGEMVALDLHLAVVLHYETHL